MKEDNCMVKHLLILSTNLLVAGPTAGASDRQNDNDRMQKAGQVFREIMDTPDKGIPHDLLDSSDQAQYGANVTSQEILDGQIQVPSSARLLIHELRAYPGATVGM
jgi:hypothetical protein